MHSGKVEANGAFFVFAKDSVIQDIEFRNCTRNRLRRSTGSTSTATASPKETRDLRYIDCTAIRCGNADSNAIWATGFDFHATNDLYGITGPPLPRRGQLGVGLPLRARRPRHADRGGRYPDGGLRQHRNGQRNTKGYPYTETFQSGYYLHNNAGRRQLHLGEEPERRLLRPGRAERHLRALHRTGSTYGWKVVKDSQGVALDECATSSNLEWGIWSAYYRQPDREGLRAAERHGQGRLSVHARVVLRQHRLREARHELALPDRGRRDSPCHQPGRPGEHYQLSKL